MSHTALIDICRDLLSEISPNSGRVTQEIKEDGTSHIQIKGLSIIKDGKMVHGLTLTLSSQVPPKLSITYKGDLLMEMDRWRDISDPVSDPRFKHLLKSCLMKCFDKVKEKYPLSEGVVYQTSAMRRADMIARIVKAYKG